MSEIYVKSEPSVAVWPAPNASRPARPAAHSPDKTLPAAESRRPLPAGQILRFKRSERLLHWSIAIPFMVCYATAVILILFYYPHPQRAFRAVFSWSHRISGVCLFVFPTLTALRNRRDFRLHLSNIKQAWTWAADDVKWLFLMGAAAVSKRITLPEQGKFNAAEKLNFMMVMGTYPVFILSGTIIWLKGYGLLEAWFVHFALAALATPLMLGHIYMATVNPDTRVGISGMFSGYVDRQWAKHHYRRWYRENFEKDESARGEPAHLRPVPRSKGNGKPPLARWTFETNVPGVFILEDLSEKGLVKSAVNEGKLVMDLLEARLEAEQAAASSETQPVTESDVFDVAILGMGPAGLSAALTAHHYGLRYLALGNSEITAAVQHCQRQRALMVELLDPRLDGTLSGANRAPADTLAVWENLLAGTLVNVRTNERVERVRRNNTALHIETTKGHYLVRYVVLTMKPRGTPRHLGVPGEHSAEELLRRTGIEAAQKVLSG